MKCLLITTLLFLPLLAQAKTYQCQYDHEGKLEKLKVVISPKMLELSFKGKEYTNCTKEKDEFGTLVDCGIRDLDLMVLINDAGDTITGGIMSSSFDLFVDLDC
ncbi:MAG: hypothetical protein CME62_03295 [Halobacteriovoraceae bacterium]|nr:hypothetical protein [Halobacteriovoraceae bacterium]|tara:strand:- start:9573 stop:9884 length:312 start_codon:yes stop_codon:yes gene_type:complete